jgi:hypothetical protein
MNFELPKQLQSLEFRFVKLKGKVPFEKSWQSGYKFNDDKIRAWLSLENNIGVIGGWGKLRIQDIDNEELGKELIDKFNTFTVKTGSGGYHFYFKSDTDKNFVLKDDLGEFRANNYQVVAPNMKHPNGNFYTVVRDVPIREISQDEFMSIIKPYMRETSTEITTTDSNNTRSEREFKEVLRLLRSGKTKKEVFDAMNDFAKWSTAHPQYRELTYNKALDVFDVDRIEKSENIQEINYLSWKELQEYVAPNYSWRVKDLIQDKKIVIIAGNSATYKSWFSLLMGISVSSGKDFLGRFEVEQGGVLYIDRENSIPELKNRLRMLCRGLEIDSSEDLPMYFLSEQAVKLDNFSDRESLRQFIIEKNIKMVVVDVYRRIISFEENDAGAVSKFFTDAMKPICEQTGACFLFLHHHRKGKHEGDEKELLRGSSDLVNFVDGIIQIKRKGDKITLCQTKNRSGKELEPFCVNINTDEQTYLKFDVSDENPYQSISEKCAKDIVKWLSENNISNFKPKDIHDFVFTKGYKKNTFFEAIDDLVQKGLIEKIARGCYKFVYSKNGSLV